MSRTGVLPVPIGLDPQPRVPVVPEVVPAPFPIPELSPLADPRLLVPVLETPPPNRFTPLLNASIRGSYKNSHVGYVVCSFTTTIESPDAELPIPIIGPPVLPKPLLIPAPSDPLVVEFTVLPVPELLLPKPLVPELLLPKPLVPDPLLPKLLPAENDPELPTVLPIPVDEAYPRPLVASPPSG